jgi:undecaprenyl-diphosphatase
MNLKLQLMIAFLLSLISLLGLGILAFLIRHDHIVQFDHAIIAIIQSFEAPALTTIMKFFTFIGATKIVWLLFVIVSLFLYVKLHHRTELLLYSAVVLGTPILNRLLKLSFQRARPELHRLIEIGGYSFPSGHAMNAFSAYAILAFLLWRHIPTRIGRTLLILFSIVMIASIGVSRIYLGVHYPSDIIAGYMASGFWVALAIWVFQRYQEKQRKPVREYVRQ